MGRPTCRLAENAAGSEGCANLESGWGGALISIDSIYHPAPERGGPSRFCPHHKRRRKFLHTLPMNFTRTYLSYFCIFLHIYACKWKGDIPWIFLYVLCIFLHIFAYFDLHVMACLFLFILRHIMDISARDTQVYKFKNAYSSCGCKVVVAFWHICAYLFCIFRIFGLILHIYCMYLTCKFGHISSILVTAYCCIFCAYFCTNTAH